MVRAAAKQSSLPGKIGVTLRSACRSSRGATRLEPSDLTVNARILVVEDDPANRDTLCELLAHMGYSPIAAHRGEDALTVLDVGTDIDVIISDVVMPGISGLEFTRKARERRPDVPIVFVTGDREAMESVLASGALALLKPYSPATLESVIGEALAPARPQ